MISQNTSYSAALVVALTVAVVTAFAALVHAVAGSPFLG